MPELRRDPITGRWVIISTDRAKRPSDFIRESVKIKGTAMCPFCPGNEGKTPPEILAYGRNALTTEAETDLVFQAQMGDRNAFAELVRRHYQEVVHVVYRMCGDAALAEDAAQEAFIKAWVNLPSFQPASSVRNWLFRIAINAALDVLRRRPESALEQGRSLAVTAQDPGPEAALVEKERADAIRQALGSLPEATRSVLVLREYGGLSYREISGVLDIPVGTVMSRLNYARNRLRDVLKRYFLQTESEND